MEQEIDIVMDSDLPPLPAPPSTQEMMEYLDRVLPVLENLDHHQRQAEQYGVRLHERGIDFRTGKAIPKSDVPSDSSEDSAGPEGP